MVAPAATCTHLVYAIGGVMHMKLATKQANAMMMVEARALATYLIPGCVGRGVRLGSESSSGGGAGVWKSGNLEIWKSRKLEIWGSGNPEIWRSGDLESRKSGVQKNQKK